MRSKTFIIALTLASLGGVAIAGPQSQNPANQNTAGPPKPGASTTAAQDTMHLTKEERNRIAEGLSSQPKQAVPTDFDGRVGSKVPDSMQTQSLPSNVTANVPQVTGLLYGRRLGRERRDVAHRTFRHVARDRRDAIEIPFGAR